MSPDDTPLAPRAATTDAERKARVELAATFRWTCRLDLHEAVANHFSYAVDSDGKRFLINPRNRHFGRIRASDLLLLDADDPSTMDRPDAPDPTAWGLHGAVHRLCPHARCAMHIHPPYGTVLACLADPTLPPLDQNAAFFFERVAFDPDYGGLALGAEAERACAHLSDPKTAILVMGNHGIMAVGRTIAETFDRLYYFERACRTYILALTTGKPLRVLPEGVARKTAAEIVTYDDPGQAHLREIMALLDAEGSDYAD
ncbi:MAG: class II aldolase/adducin family protein [Pikeienuella sp.]